MLFGDDSFLGGEINSAEGESGGSAAFWRLLIIFGAFISRDGAREFQFDCGHRTAGGGECRGVVWRGVVGRSLTFGPVVTADIYWLLTLGKR